MTLYLKAKSERAMRTLLAKALPGFVVDGEIVAYTHKWAVDWGIPIVSVPAVMDKAGKQTKAAVMEAGFFANVAILDDKLNTAALDAADQKPGNPQRVFA